MTNFERWIQALLIIVLLLAHLWNRVEKLSSYASTWIRKLKRKKIAGNFGKLCQLCKLHKNLVPQIADFLSDYVPTIEKGCFYSIYWWILRFQMISKSCKFGQHNYYMWKFAKLWFKYFNVGKSQFNYKNNSVKTPNPKEVLHLLENYIKILTFMETIMERFTSGNIIIFKQSIFKPILFRIL